MLYLTIGTCILVVLFVTCMCVWSVLLGGHEARLASRASRRVVCALWAASILLALASRIVERDWVHLFWSVQIPITSLLLCSGAFLDATRRDDAASQAHASRSTWAFLVMVATLGLLPLLLETVLPEQRVIGRDIGHPLPRLFDLARWGFDGPLPEALSPLTDVERARGVGHLPREVTVPMGTLLIAAWGSIVFVLLAAIGRFVPTARARRSFLLLAPTTLAALACFVLRPTAPVRPTSACLDASFFLPLSSFDSGIWTSEPVVMRSFGPVMVAAILCALLVPLVTSYRLPDRGHRSANHEAEHGRAATA
jgi:hypothetical protein